MCDTVPVTKAERIIELAGAKWVGLQSQHHIGEGQLVLFRDPVTGSTCALREEDLSVSAVLAKLESKWKEFGLGRK